MNAKMLIVVLASTACAASGQLLLKLGANQQESISGYVNPQVFFGLVLYVVGAALWLVALSRLPLMLVYPFTLLTFLLVGAGSAFILHETPGRMLMLGWLIIAAGLAVVSAAMLG
ncbi:MAG: hypothetical protein KGO53_00925 [Alphaproteobacteria bacterium]|nr:hypothetical protein [Alphaproteobacteria bacterium]